MADDVTGAGDTGVQLVRHGYLTVVLLDGSPMGPQGALNCVLDTESRHLPPEAAYQKTKDMLQAFDLRQFSFVQKKVDSTLRGNIAWEVRALDEAYQSGLVLFMPALPDFGRTTLQGMHRLHGKRLMDTELARDPGSPVREDRLAPLLQSAFREPVQSILLDQIRAGQISFTGGRLFACDAETNGDMRRVMRAALDTSKRVLWVGSAALVDNFLALSGQARPALAVVASISSVARAQVERAAQGADVVPIDVADLLSGAKPIEDTLNQALSLLRQGRDVLLVSDATLSRHRLDQALASGRDRQALMAEAMALIGQLARRIVAAVPLSGLFLSGGDTAVHVLKALEAGPLRILGEVLAGIPLSRITAGPQAGLHIVTKAGGFGGEDAIAFSLRKLREVASQPDVEETPL